MKNVTDLKKTSTGENDSNGTVMGTDVVEQGKVTASCLISYVQILMAFCEHSFMCLSLFCDHL